MAHKKAGGSTRLGRDSQAKRLGVKRYAGETVKPGDIIVRQRGSYYRAGDGVDMGKDYTIFSKIDGVVKFQKKMARTFSNSLKNRQFVHVVKK